jgi:hypothetical protein
MSPSPQPAVTTTADRRVNSIKDLFIALSPFHGVTPAAMGRTVTLLQDNQEVYASQGGEKSLEGASCAH